MEKSTIVVNLSKDCTKPHLFTFIQGHIILLLAEKRHRVQVTVKFLFFFPLDGFIVRLHKVHSNRTPQLGRGKRHRIKWEPLPL